MDVFCSIRSLFHLNILHHDKRSLILCLNQNRFQLKQNYIRNKTKSFNFDLFINQNIWKHSNFAEIFHKTSLIEQKAKTHLCFTPK